jgi:hypothetical protein
VVLDNVASYTKPDLELGKDAINVSARSSVSLPGWH